MDLEELPAHTAVGRRGEGNEERLAPGFLFKGNRVGLQVNGFDYLTCVH